MSTPTKYSKKSFVAGVEAYMKEKRERFIKDVTGTPLYAPTVEYAIREGWILPGETLDAITNDSIFPNHDLWEWVRKIESAPESKTEAVRREASEAIRAAVVDGLREANAGIERIRQGDYTVTVALGDANKAEGCAVSEAGRVFPATLAGEKEQEQGSPPPALKSPLSAIPEGVASHVINVHSFTVDGVEVNTLDWQVLELARSAQVQRKPITVEHKPSPLGNIVIKASL